MNDHIATDRTASADKRGASVPVWQAFSTRPQSGKGFAQRTGARSKIDRSHRGVSCSSGIDRPTDANSQLLKLVMEYFSDCGPELIMCRQTPWASVTFSGVRHEMLFSFGTAPSHKRLNDLRLSDIELKGYIIADIVADLFWQGSAHHFKVEALSVAE